MKNHPRRGNWQLTHTHRQAVFEKNELCNTQHGQLAFRCGLISGKPPNTAAPQAIVLHLPEGVEIVIVLAWGVCGAGRLHG